MAVRLQLVVAVAQNQGIGYQGGLPWPRLRYVTIKNGVEYLQFHITTSQCSPFRTDLKFMARKTTETSDPSA